MTSKQRILALVLGLVSAYVGAGTVTAATATNPLLAPWTGSTAAFPLGMPAIPSATKRRS